MDHRNKVEWVVLAASVIAVASVVGFLVADGLSDRGRPPAPVVELHFDKAYVTSTGWLLPATASNNGDRSAEGVTLLATATVDGAEEEAEVSVAYLPAGTHVPVTFGFSAKPDSKIEVRVTGFVP